MSKYRTSIHEYIAGWDFATPELKAAQMAYVTRCDMTPDPERFLENLIASNDAPTNVHRVPSFSKTLTRWLNKYRTSIHEYMDREEHLYQIVKETTG